MLCFFFQSEFLWQGFFVIYSEKKTSCKCTNYDLNVTCVSNVEVFCHLFFLGGFADNTEVFLFV